MMQHSDFPMPIKKNVVSGKYIAPEKLLDVCWLEKRVAVLRRDGERCQGVGQDEQQCNKASKNGDRLEIHHRNYTTSDPWEEPMENLISLCRDHHEQEKNANLGQAAREVGDALMKLNWMVGHRKLLTRCISEKIVSPEQLCRFIHEQMK
jgi:hypothetical protein